MKIGIFSEFFYPHIGGQEIKYYRIGKKLVEIGHDVIVYTIGDTNKGSYIRDGIIVNEVIHIPEYANNGYRKLSDLLKIYTFTRYKLNALKDDLDAIIINQMPMIHLLIDFKKRIKSKIYLLDVIEYWKKPFLGLFYINMLKKYDGFLALNKWVLFYIRNLIKKSHKVMLLPPPIEVDRFKTGVLKKDFNKILYVGRLTNHKNVQLALYAMKYIIEKIPNISFHIVGLGPKYVYLNNLAKLLGIDNNVVFYGAVDEEKLVDLYKKSFVFLMPSKREGYSISSIEAMAAATPVITCDYQYNYTKILVKDSCGGLICKPSPKQLAKAIIELYTDRSRWSMLSNNAVTFAREHDISYIVSRLEKFIWKLI